MKRLEQYDVYEIPVDRVYYDRSFNCRGAFTLESVQELSQSIAQNGLHFPVTVQPAASVKGGLPEGYDYRLLAGHRRFQAVTRFLQWPAIPANIRPNLSERAARLLNFTENLERRDLNILEEARALRNLYPEGVTLREAARELKRPTRWVHIRLRLLTLPDEIQTKAAAGLLSTVNLETILGLEDPAEQLKAAEEIWRAKERSKTKFLQFVSPEYQRQFRCRRSKAQIKAMVTQMLEAGIEGLAPRALVWAAGYITEEELLQDLQQEDARRSDHGRSPEE